MFHKLRPGYHKIRRENIRLSEEIEKAQNNTTERPPKYTCKVCGKNRRRENHVYCSKECRHKDKYVSAPCASCGKLVERRKAEIAYGIRCYKVKLGLVFCSRRCWGKYAGTHYIEGYNTKGYKKKARV